MEEGEHRFLSLCASDVETTECSKEHGNFTISLNIGLSVA